MAPTPRFDVAQKPAPESGGGGFGPGFDVRIPQSPPAALGEYGRSGNAGTKFLIDPKNDLIAIYMVQVGDGDRIMLRTSSTTWCARQSSDRLEAARLSNGSRLPRFGGYRCRPKNSIIRAVESFVAVAL